MTDHKFETIYNIALSYFSNYNFMMYLFKEHIYNSYNLYIHNKKAIYHINIERHTTPEEVAETIVKFGNTIPEIRSAIISEDMERLLVSSETKETT